MSDYICTKAEILDEGKDVALSFKKIGSEVTRNTTTMTAEAWQQALNYSFLWQEEKKIVAHLARRVDELTRENEELRKELADENWDSSEVTGGK